MSLASLVGLQMKNVGPHNDEQFVELSLRETWVVMLIDIKGEELS